MGELFLAYGHGFTRTHRSVRVRMDPGTLVKFGPDLDPVEIGPDGKLDPHTEAEEGDTERHYLATTVGRAIFNDILPAGMPYYNYQLSKKGIAGLISDCHRLLGRDATLTLLDDLKDLGFKSATRAGLSFAKDDMRVPQTKQDILDETQGEIDGVEQAFQKGVITDGERYLKIIDLWTAAREKVGKDLMKVLEADVRKDDVYVNPIFCMVTSGARGSIDQIRQLAGMRGLMAKPSGKIIETPIKANFREGLKVLEYFSSTHGARKGLADTALKTADAGYLTRKLTDVAQNVVMTTEDCGTPNGIYKSPVYKGEKRRRQLGARRSVAGSRATRSWTSPPSEIIVRENELITEEAARRIEQAHGIRQAPGAQFRADLRGGARRAAPAATAWTSRQGHPRRARARGGHHRRPVDRRAGHPAHDADVPHRRYGEPLGRAVRGARVAATARSSSRTCRSVKNVDEQDDCRPEPQR